MCTSFNGTSDCRFVYSYTDFWAIGKKLKSWLFQGSGTANYTEYNKLSGNIVLLLYTRIYIFRVR